MSPGKFLTELCGISADDKALEVDHIVPRNRGGPDDLTNLQALCYSCNAMKRDRDDTDFRGVMETYGLREPGCPFCDVESAKIVAENRLCFAIMDKFPVTERHTAIIPKRPSQIKREIARADGKVSGFNMGVNEGVSAGQTISHCHVHLIPRREGDVENPRGGVKGVIPAKQN